MAEAKAIIPNSEDALKVREATKDDSTSSWGLRILKSALKIAGGKATESVIRVLKQW